LIQTSRDGALKRQGLLFKHEFQKWQNGENNPVRQELKKGPEGP
jgi:hypothetical protein